MSDFDAYSYYFLSLPFTQIIEKQERKPFRYYSLQVSLPLHLSTKLKVKTDKQAGRLQYGIEVTQEKGPSFTDLFLSTGEKLTVVQLMKKFVRFEVLIEVVMKISLSPGK
jgi:DUF1365 family protein